MIKTLYIFNKFPPFAVELHLGFLQQKKWKIILFSHYTRLVLSHSLLLGSSRKKFHISVISSKTLFNLFRFESSGKFSSYSARSSSKANFPNYNFSFKQIANGIIIFLIQSLIQTKKKKRKHNFSMIKLKFKLFYLWRHHWNINYRILKKKIYFLEICLTKSSRCGMSGRSISVGSICLVSSNKATMTLIMF